LNSSSGTSTRGVLATCRHSGFGIGNGAIYRLGLRGSDTPVHIREVITFPRMLHQYEP